MAPDIDQDIDPVGADAGGDVRVGQSADRRDLAFCRQIGLALGVRAIEKHLDGVEIVVF